MKKKKIITISSLVVALSAGILSTSLISYAAYADSKRKIAQPIGIAGKVGRIVLLSPGVWDLDNPDYMLFVWKNNKNTGTWIKSTGIQSEGYIVFHIQDVANLEFTEDTYSKINCIFARLDPGRPKLTNSQLASKHDGYFTEKYDNNTKYCIWNITSDVKTAWKSGENWNLFKVTTWGVSWADHGDGSICNAEVWAQYDLTVS